MAAAPPPANSISVPPFHQFWSEKKVLMAPTTNNAIPVKTIANKKALPFFPNNTYGKRGMEPAIKKETNVTSAEFMALPVEEEDRPRRSKITKSKKNSLFF